MIYEDLFDYKKQEEMRSFFLNMLAPLGKKKDFKKGDLIKIYEEERFVGIVINGKVKGSLYSSKGTEKLLYILRAGEIFGESNYFVSGGSHSIIKAMEPSTISFIPKNILDSYLDKNPKAYSFFIHSITRKYRISISQMSDAIFSSSKTKVANTLYRLTVQDSKKEANEYIIKTHLTHQTLANLIGCSRITVTKVLKELRQLNILDIRDKKIVVKDLDALKSMCQS
ncbi:Crp/Fnr family transcriptional regulator [Hathewaya histolytica]|uniref:Crp/Fnr family transcriptional regulator n=1 Tax=Hathewaya histolytica TaxID=1498 RepID=UPI003B67E9AD